jgi:hypothetical protein
MVENRRKFEHAALRSSSRGIVVPENTAENYATVGVLKEPRLSRDSSGKLRLRFDIFRILASR